MTLRDEPWPAGLVPSLLVLGAILVVALGGLTLTGNFPKVLRVTLAAAGYVSVLLALTRGRSSLSVWSFVAAGALAGLVSGVVRTSTSSAVVAIGTAAAALLLGPLHWWALRSWQSRADIS